MGRLEPLCCAGGSSGIGLDAARGFLQEGYNVVIGGRIEDKLKQATKTLGNEDCTAYVAGNIGEPETGNKCPSVTIGIDNPLVLCKI